MAENQTGGSANPAGTQPAAGNTVRLVVRIVLFGILLYLICALPYDFFIARPGQAAAWLKLENEDPEKGPLGLLQTKNTGKGDVETTNEKVAEVLGRGPSRTEAFEDQGYTQEVYSWRGGLPWRTYDIYVTYRHKKGKLLLEHAFLNTRPYDPSNEQPDQVTEPSDAGSDASGDTTPPTGPPEGGPRPPGRPPDAGGPRRPDAEETPKKPDGEDAPKKPSADDAPKKPDREDAPKKPADEGAENKSPE